MGLTHDSYSCQFRFGPHFNWASKMKCFGQLGISGKCFKVMLLKNKKIILLNFKNKYYNLNGMNFYIKNLKLGWALYTYIYIIGAAYFKCFKTFHRWVSFWSPQIHLGPKGPKLKRQFT